MLGTLLRHNWHEFNSKMAETDETHLSALGKEAAMGDDVAFMDMVNEFPIPMHL